MNSIEKVSVHGGHSGQFCNHAADSLEEIVRAYIDQGFSWIGVTEHAPAISEELLYADQREDGLTPAILLGQFGSYMQECRRLQEKYASSITIYAAMEIETYSGYETFVPQLIEKFSPDYIVGSVHFVNDINFDYSSEMYEQAAFSVGGIDELYKSYFDVQYEMIKNLCPAVVGHFDLIRIFDPGYRRRLELPEISTRIRRNLALIKELGLVMDFNLRSLAKGADEPYITASILQQVKDLDIALVPGDDSHGLSSVGNYMEQGIKLLQDKGFNTKWQKPALLT
jgi:histidinol-phosphatase (PHP family)